MFRSKKKDILASAKKGKKDNGPASEPPTEPNTPPETPPSRAAASSGHPALSVATASLTDYQEMQLRGRTQLRIVLTEVAREERRTANLLAKFQQVVPSLQVYKAQVADLQKQLQERPVVATAGRDGPNDTEMAALRSILLAEVQREEQRTAQLSSEVHAMRSQEAQLLGAQEDARAVAEAAQEAVAEAEEAAKAEAGDGGGCWGGPTVAARAGFDLARLLLRSCEYGWPSPLPDGQAPETVALRLLRRAATEGHRGATARRDAICAAGAACGDEGDSLTPEVFALACAP